MEFLANARRSLQEAEENYFAVHAQTRKASNAASGEAEHGHLDELA
jgi:hypothetical protein